MKGHTGVKGNEEADSKANATAWIGKRILRPTIATPAGIRQAYPHPSKELWKWDNQAIKALMYLATDKGYQRAWLY